METLEKVDFTNSVNNVSSEEQKVLDAVIAAGLNSLAGYMRHVGSKEKDILDKFSEQSFDKIIPCFDMLSAELQLYIFTPHKDCFLEYMRSVKGSK